jgi:arylsulfatase A-like enzyme
LLIQQWGMLDKKTVSANGVAFAAAAYDDCIADLDEQLGKLFDELTQRGVLDRTWLIVTADHGESFGEHPGIFCHGTSLYDTEVHVPLLVIPPGGSPAGQSIKEAVSLREIAATIVDFAGQSAGSPFPGESLARFGKPAGVPQPIPAGSVAPALAEVVPHDPEKRDYWGMPHALAALGAVKEREWSYIRREGDAREQLYHLSKDANEQRNLAGDPSTQSTLERMRETLSRLTQGPMLPERFNP